MKYICLKIDYLDKKIDWWDWDENDEERVEYSRITHAAICGYHKVKNTVYGIYEAITLDPYAYYDILMDAKRNILKYGDSFMILLDEKIVLERSYLDDRDHRVYKQEEGLEGELCLI